MANVLKANKVYEYLWPLYLSQYQYRIQAREDQDEKQDEGLEDVYRCIYVQNCPLLFLIFLFDDITALFGIFSHIVEDIHFHMPYKIYNLFP